tara:strand:- start:737 stop:964 length:228 start_codon:yes stop_codon:yes gene_type:complete
MKNVKDIKTQIGKLNEFDLIKIRDLGKEIENIGKNKEISSEGLKKLYNIQTNLHMFIEQYSNRLLHLLKQNHMVD